MKKILILFVISSFSMVLFSQSKDTPAASATETKSETKNFFEQDANFRICFKGEPTTNVQAIETAVGEINMVTYMYEESAEAVFMVAYSEYPAEHIAANDSKVLLENAKDGFLGSLLLTLVNEEKISINNYPGILLKAGSGTYYSIAADYLVGDILYQVAILRSDRYPTQTEIDNFIGTFELK